MLLFHKYTYMWVFVLVLALLIIGVSKKDNWTPNSYRVNSMFPDEVPQIPSWSPTNAPDEVPQIPSNAPSNVPEIVGPTNAPNIPPPPGNYELHPNTKTKRVMHNETTSIRYFINTDLKDCDARGTCLSDDEPCTRFLGEYGSLCSKDHNANVYYSTIDDCKRACDLTPDCAGFDVYNPLMQNDEFICRMKTVSNENVYEFDDNYDHYERTQHVHPMVTFDAPFGYDRHENQQNWKSLLCEPNVRGGCLQSNLESSSCPSYRADDDGKICSHGRTLFSVFNPSQCSRECDISRGCVGFNISRHVRDDGMYSCILQGDDHDSAVPTEPRHSTTMDFYSKQSYERPEPVPEEYERLWNRAVSSDYDIPCSLAERLTGGACLSGDDPCTQLESVFSGRVCSQKRPLVVSTVQDCADECNITANCAGFDVTENINGQQVCTMKTRSDEITRSRNNFTASYTKTH